MLLTIDTGNTQTVIGIYNGSKLERMWRISTNKKDTADELRLKLLPLLASDGLQPSMLKGSIVASVVPALTRSWTSALATALGREPLVCTALAAGGLFDTTYGNPTEIGADRVDGFVRRVFAELGYETPVVATGGLATTMAPLCATVTDVNPELTLEGLRLIYENN